MATEPLPLVVPLIHLKAKELDERDYSYITYIRKQLANEPLYQEYIDYCTDELIIRFLVARSNVVATKEAIITAIKWRKTRLPVKGILGIYTYNLCVIMCLRVKIHSEICIFPAWVLEEALAYYP